ncbi:MAG: HAMP domain-containing histidine kinase [Firmicutes bacterium]|nr:HAMP domain-containing histidine kinase [Bacillota bacterium]
MKNAVRIFIGMLVIASSVLMFLGFYAIDNAYRMEINMVQNIAGAVISEYPETESIFISSVADETMKNRAYGAELMSAYGYDNEKSLTEVVRYRRIINVYILTVVLFFTASGLCGYRFYKFVKHSREFQEEKILDILDNCLDDNYDFLEADGKINELDNPQFKDMLRKLGEALRLKTERLSEERDNTKTLVTDISHQLKNPIGAVNLCLAMCAESDSEAERCEFLSRSIAQMDKLKVLTDSLVNVSRLETDMIKLSIETASLAEMLIDSVNTVYQKIKDNNTDINIDEFDDILLKFDKKWTREAVANILDNAVKYSPMGSKIFIRVQKMYSFVRIEIEDNGIGIPKSEYNKIFKRFYRGENAEVRSREGSGIGLYLTRKILEEQGGTVSVRSGREAGSVFIVQLPL